MKKVFLNEFSTAELEAMFAAGDIDSAITVSGSCESHGGHLPLGPDLFVPTEVARQAAPRLARTVVVPGVPFGTSMHYNANPMVISLRDGDGRRRGYVREPACLLHPAHLCAERP